MFVKTIDKKLFCQQNKSEHFFSDVIYKEVTYDNEFTYKKYRNNK